MFVFCFRRNVVTRKAGDVKVELEVLFDGSSTGPLPANNEILGTLKDAASNLNTEFNFSIDATSISIISELTITPDILNYVNTENSDQFVKDFCLYVC